MGARGHTDDERSPAPGTPEGSIAPVQGGVTRGLRPEEERFLEAFDRKFRNFLEYARHFLNRSDSADTRNGILASVALKCATATRGITGEPQEVIDTAVMYLAWLKSA